MKETIAKFCLILIFIISSSCGYKVLDNQGSKDFSIKEIKTSTKLIKEIMSSVKNSDLHSFSIPLLVDINNGENWGELH